MHDLKNSGLAEVCSTIIHKQPISTLRRHINSVGTQSGKLQFNILHCVHILIRHFPNIFSLFKCLRIHLEQFFVPQRADERAKGSGNLESRRRSKNCLKNYLVLDLIIFNLFFAVLINDYYICDYYNTISKTRQSFDFLSEKTSILNYVNFCSKELIKWTFQRFAVIREYVYCLLLSLTVVKNRSKNDSQFSILGSRNFPAKTGRADHPKCERSPQVYTQQRNASTADTKR